MKFRVIYIFVFMFLTLYVQSCTFVDSTLTSYSMEIINGSEYGVSIYLDDVYQFYLGSGESTTITDVSGGSHTLKARVTTLLGDIVMNETTFNLDSDITWTV